ncbi:MAG: transposase [Candidatus Levybacteria bacterium]|nr:transposase [Candidatus Levybacteria bacterium]
MPARNSRKQYINDAYYHIYNRGVEKRKIFMDQQDYGVFLSYLKQYLTPKNEKELRKQLANSDISSRHKDKILKLLRLNNFCGEITLLAYCLMPNHFHLFVKQKGGGVIDAFMNSLGTRYTMYFNKKYKRVGSLYQGVYKAALVLSEDQFIYLSKYIHKQAVPNQPSSYTEYLGKRNTEWINTKEILSYFSNTNPTLSYQSFVEETEDFGRIQNIILEEDEV